MTNRTSEPELLPEELLWAEGGHVSDIVLTAMADGQAEIIPALALTHVNGCASCTTHLGNAALLSLHTGRELVFSAQHANEVKEARDSQRVSAFTQRAPFPRLAVLLGLAFAALGLVPSLIHAPAQLGGARFFATHDIPLLAAGLGTLREKLLGPGSASGLVLTYGAAALVIVMGFALVRLLPKKEVS